MEFEFFFFFLTKSKKPSLLKEPSTKKGGSAKFLRTSSSMAEKPFRPLFSKRARSVVRIKSFSCEVFKMMKIY